MTDNLRDWFTMQGMPTADVDETDDSAKVIKAVTEESDKQNFSSRDGTRMTVQPPFMASRKDIWALIQAMRGAGSTGDK